MKCLKNNKSIVMTLSCTVLMIMLINLISVLPTNALFVDAPEKPVLVYNTQIDGIKPGILEVDKNSIEKTSTDGLEFIVLIGRTETNDKTITEDYKITVNNSNCKITKKNNISGDYGDNTTFTYAPNDENMAENKVTVVCSSGAFNENRELIVNISLEEILNGIKFKPRELNFQYVDEEVINLSYEDLIDQMVEFLGNNGVPTVTKEEVKDFAAYYDVTKMVEDFSDIKIPGVMVNISDGSYSFSFNEELKIKFEEYRGSKEYLDFTKDVEKYETEYPDTVNYLSKLPQNESNPIYNTIMNEPSDKRDIAYYIYLESGDKLSVVKLGLDNSVEIHDISKIENGMELYLYIPAGSEDLDSKVIEILRNKFCVKKEMVTNENDLHKIYDYVVSEKLETCPYEESVKEKVEEEIVVKKDDLYSEAVKKLDEDLSNTVEFINSFELNETNPFYQNFDNTLTKKYVYYEVQVIDNNEALEVLLNDSEQIVIDYLTLIEVGNNKIKISKIEDLDSLFGLDKIFIYNNDELLINKIKELLKIDEKISDEETVLEKQVEILAEIEKVLKTGNELNVYTIKDNLKGIVFEEITKDKEISYKKYTFKDEEVKDEKTDYEKFIELLDSYSFGNTVSYIKSFDESINPFYKDYKALEQVNYIYYEVPVVNDDGDVQSLDEVIIDYLTLIEVGNNEIKITKVNDLSKILVNGFKIYGDDSNLIKEIKLQFKLGEEVVDIDVNYKSLLAEIEKVENNGNTYKVYSINDSTSLVLEERIAKLDETSLNILQYKVFDLEEEKEEIPVEPPISDETVTEDVGGDLENKDEVKQDEILGEEENKIIEVDKATNGGDEDETKNVIGDDQEQNVGDDSLSMRDDVSSETSDTLPSSTPSDTLDDLNNTNLEGNNLSAQDYIPSSSSSNVEVLNI